MCHRSSQFLWRSPNQHQAPGFSELLSLAVRSRSRKSSYDARSYQRCSDPSITVPPLLTGVAKMTHHSPPLPISYLRFRSLRGRMNRNIVCKASILSMLDGIDRNFGAILGQRSVDRHLAEARPQRESDTRMLQMICKTKVSERNLVMCQVERTRTI